MKVMDVSGFGFLFIDHVDHVDVLVYSEDRSLRFDIPMNSRQLMDLAYALTTKARKLEKIEDAA